MAERDFTSLKSKKKKGRFTKRFKLFIVCSSYILLEKDGRSGMPQA